MPRQYITPYDFYEMNKLAFGQNDRDDSKIGQCHMASNGHNEFNTLAPGRF